MQAVELLEYMVEQICVEAKKQNINDFDELVKYLNGTTLEQELLSLYFKYGTKNNQIDVMKMYSILRHIFRERSDVTEVLFSLDNYYHDPINIYVVDVALDEVVGPHMNFLKLYNELERLKEFATEEQLFKDLRWVVFDNITHDYLKED